MVCQGCGRREATTCLGGRKASGGAWEIWLCDECAPDEPEPTEEQFQTWLAEHPEHALTPEQIQEASEIRRDGVGHERRRSECDHHVAPDPGRR